MEQLPGRATGTHPRGLPDALAAERRTLVMAVLNVTPDSFSDGGRFLDPDAAIAHALDQVRAGADLVDVGGESTRPGAQRIPIGEELRRVIPVVSALARAGVVVSIDTMRAQVADAAVAAGALRATLAGVLSYRSWAAAMISQDLHLLSNVHLRRSPRP